MTGISVRGVLGTVLSGLRDAAQRFPLPLACAGLFTLLSIGDNHNARFVPSGDDLKRIQSVLVPSFFFLLAAKLWVEDRAWRWPAHGLLAAGGCALLALRIYTLPTSDTVWFEGHLLFLGPAVVLLAMVSPFLDRGSTPEAFWDFNRAAWLGAAFGFLLALVLAIGLTSAFYAIEELFAVGLDSDLVADVWVIALALVWPWYALSAVPTRFAAPDGAYCPKLIGHLTSYLLVPLVLVYLAILYAYIAKIAIDWQLPKGQVASLVASYATFGVATHLMAYPLRESGHHLLRLFHRFFYPALFAPVAVLALALWLRVDAYGVTEQRYLLAVFALWLAAMAVYCSWSRSDRLVAIPLSLAVLLALSSFGPWGAVGLSTTSQMTRLEQVMMANGLLQNGRIVPARAPVSSDDAKRISSIIGYLGERDRLALLDPWLVDLESDDRRDQYRIVAAMGLEFIEPWQSEPHFSYHRASGEPEIMDISGFQVLTRQSLWRGQSAALDLTPSLRDGPKHYEIRLYSEDALLTFLEGDTALVRFDLGRLEAALRGESDPPARDRMMILDQSQSGWRVRLLVISMNGQSAPGGPEIESISFLLLIGRAHNPV